MVVEGRKEKDEKEVGKGREKKNGRKTREDAGRRGGLGRLEEMRREKAG